MGDLTHSFSLSEFACHDGTPVPAELLPNVQQLANNLQVLRDRVGVPIHVVSGYRTPAHNAMVDGAGHSQHMLGHAMDFFIPGVALEKIRFAGLRLQRGGVGLVRSRPRR